VKTCGCVGWHWNLIQGWLSFFIGPCLRTSYLPWLFTMWIYMCDLYLMLHKLLLSLLICGWIKGNKIPLPLS
jgi:hypothetical protein